MDDDKIAGAGGIFQCQSDALGGRLHAVYGRA
jgi:hypothetical protein